MTKIQKKTTKMPFTTFLLWGFGLMFFIASVMIFNNGHIDASMYFFLTGLLFFPPVIEFIKKSFNIGVSRKIRAILIIITFCLGVWWLPEVPEETYQNETITEEIPAIQPIPAKIINLDDVSDYSLKASDLSIIGDFEESISSRVLYEREELPADYMNLDIIGMYIVEFFDSSHDTEGISRVSHTIAVFEDGGSCKITEGDEELNIGIEGTTSYLSEGMETRFDLTYSTKSLSVCFPKNNIVNIIKFYYYDQLSIGQIDEIKPIIIDLMNRQ